LIHHCVEDTVKCPDNAYGGVIEKAEGERPLAVFDSPPSKKSGELMTKQFEKGDQNIYRQTEE